MAPVFSRFSTAAGGVLRAAEQECRNHNHYYVGAEHVLVALLEERDPAIESRLAAEHIAVPDVHAELKRTLGMGEERMWEGIIVTPRVRTIVHAAETSAGARDIEPIDLYDALRREDGGLAADILRRAARAPAPDA